jgi:hypothetical protein
MSAEFERAFVAMSYLLGRRGAELDSALRAPSDETRRVISGLSHPDRAVRAQVLAAELARVAASLEKRRFR